MIFIDALQRLVHNSGLPRGGAVWQLVGLITRRSQVQILPPQPRLYTKRRLVRRFVFLRSVCRFPLLLLNGLGKAGDTPMGRLTFSRLSASDLRAFIRQLDREMAIRKV